MSAYPRASAVLGRLATLPGVREAAAPSPPGTVRIETPIPGLQSEGRARPHARAPRCPDDLTDRLLTAEREGQLSAEAARDLAELRRRGQFPPAIPRATPR
jgi:hypothetical protein